MLWLVNGWLCLQYENIFSICPRWANNGDYEAKTMVARLTTEHYHGQHPAPGRHACTACLMLTHPHSPTAFLRSSNTWRKLLLKLSFCWKYCSRIFHKTRYIKKLHSPLVGEFFCQLKHLPEAVEATCGHASQLFADTTCFNVKLAKIPERSFQQSLGDQFSLSISITEECKVDTSHMAKLLVSGHWLGGRGGCKSMTWSGWEVVWRRCGGAGDQAAWLGGRAVHGSRRPQLRAQRAGPGCWRSCAV